VDQAENCKIFLKQRTTRRKRIDIIRENKYDKEKTME
jgi:hypothetical protein